MKNDKPLTVVSPGTQKRNFTHIDDIVDGLLLVGENGYGDEFGIGSPESYTIKEIAEMFDGEVEMLPERKGNRMIADVISSKTEALGWKSTRTIKEYINELRNNNWK
jgi:UDP-glucose 4-epimerase